MASEPLGEGLRQQAAGTRKDSARDPHPGGDPRGYRRERPPGAHLGRRARRVGIAKGNLQYYFPTRDDLLRAAFAEQIERHKRNWQAAADQPARTASERLENLIAFELTANRDSHFVAQVLERYTLERRDPDLRRLSDAWHGWLNERYAKIIARMRPSLSPLACRQTAIALYALPVGATPYTSDDPAIPEAADGLDSRIAAIALRMIDIAR